MIKDIGTEPTRETSSDTDEDLDNLRILRCAVYFYFLVKCPSCFVSDGQIVTAETVKHSQI